MSDNFFEIGYDYIFRLLKIKEACLKYNVKPNHITGLNLFISLIHLSIKNNNKFIILFFHEISVVLDFLDGWVARENNESSELGKYLDQFADLVTHFTTLSKILKKVNYKVNKPLSNTIIYALKTAIQASPSFTINDKSNSHISEHIVIPSYILSL